MDPSAISNSIAEIPKACFNHQNRFEHSMNKVLPRARFYTRVNGFQVKFMVLLMIFLGILTVEYRYVADD
jgi:hypothetical protein